MKNILNSRLLAPAVLAVAISLSSCAQTPPNPAITAFMKGHPQLGLGTATQAEDAKDWPQGKRQHVITDSGKRLIFFLKGEQVQAVYDESGSHRVLVWSATSDSSATDQVELPTTIG